MSFTHVKGREEKMVTQLASGFAPFTVLGSGS